MATALITGISGQDGSFLARLLLDHGYVVVGTSRNINAANFNGLSYLGIDDQVSLVECSFGSQKAVNHLIEEIQPDEIYNLAAQSSVGYSFQNPIGALEFNLLSVAYLLDAIKNIDKKIKFYQASSSEMFGNINVLPVKEDSYFHPSSPYGISKASAHWLTVNYREAYGIFASCGILFNHESPLRGADYVTKKIINSAIRIKNGELDKLKLGNLEVIRDWGYAPRYVEAMWLLMQQELPGDFLICSNTKMSLRNFAEIAFNQLGLNFDEHVEIDKSLYRAVDLEMMWGDNTKAREILNWDYDLSTHQLVSTLIEEEEKFMSWQQSRIT